MGFDFVKNFLGVKAMSVKENLIEKLISWDPEAATEAEIATMYDNLTELSEKFEKAKIDLEREKREAEIIRAQYNKKVDVLNVLTERLNNESYNNKEEVQEAIDSLTQELIILKEEVKRELDEATDAQEYFNVIKQTMTNTKEKLNTARRNLENAKKRMQTAEIKLENAKEKEKRVKELAGLTKAMSSTGVAFDALNKKAEQLEIKTAASTNRASLLTPEQKFSNKLIDDVMNDLTQKSSPTKVTFEKL